MTKYLESNLPDNIRAHVVYLHEGNKSKNQLKKIARADSRYVTLAKLIDTDTDQVVGTGMAACSRHDNPSRRVGRAIAIGRAFVDYDMYSSHKVI